MKKDNTVVPLFGDDGEDVVEILPWVVERNQHGRPFPIRPCTEDELDRYYDTIGVPELIDLADK